MKRNAPIPTQPSVTIFIPVLNEEAIICQSVRKVASRLANRKGSWRIVVVDDGSTDRTVEVLLPLLSDTIRLSRSSKGNSWRENMGRAMAEADTDVVGFVDADLSPDIETLPVLIDALVDGADGAVGSRYLPDSRLERSGHRIAASYAYTTFLSLLFGRSVADYQCGLKVFRTQVFKHLAEVSRYEGPLLRGWFWDAEILIRAIRMGYRVVEVPITWIESPRSSYRLASQLRLIPYILAFRLRLFREPTTHEPPRD
jgi:glycosyltransferase involved in cell wall biosynthesis